MGYPKFRYPSSIKRPLSIDEFPDPPNCENQTGTYGGFKIGVLPFGPKFAKFKLGNRLAKRIPLFGGIRRRAGE